MFGLTEGPPTHDPLAVAAVIFPDAFHDNDGERYAIEVVTEGEHGSSDQIRASDSQCGRTVATLLPPSSEGVRIPRSLDQARLWQILDECLAHAG